MILKKTSYRNSHFLSNKLDLAITQTFIHYVYSNTCTPPPTLPPLHHDILDLASTHTFILPTHTYTLIHIPPAQFNGREMICGLFWGGDFFGGGIFFFYGDWTRKLEIRTRKKFLAMDEACMATFRPTPGFKGRTSVSSGFWTEETLIFASAGPYCRTHPVKTTEGLSVAGRESSNKNKQNLK